MWPEVGSGSDQLSLAAVRPPRASRTAWSQRVSQSRWTCKGAWSSTLPWDPCEVVLQLGGFYLISAGSFFYTTELELSLALRCHTLYDEPIQRVSWVVPRSKTDPQALSKARSWDFVVSAS